MYKSFAWSMQYQNSAFFFRISTCVFYHCMKLQYKTRSFKWNFLRKAQNICCIKAYPYTHTHFMEKSLHLHSLSGFFSLHVKWTLLIHTFVWRLSSLNYESVIKWKAIHSHTAVAIILFNCFSVYDDRRRIRHGKLVGTFFRHYINGNGQ